MTGNVRGNLGGAGTSARRLVVRRAVCVRSEPPPRLAQPWLILGSRLDASQTRAERDLPAMIARTRPRACGNFCLNAPSGACSPHATTEPLHHRREGALAPPESCALTARVSSAAHQGVSPPFGESRSGNSRQLLAEGCGSARRAAHDRYNGQRPHAVGDPHFEGESVSPSPVRG
jgi:hypothetical protein